MTNNDKKVAEKVSLFECSTCAYTTQYKSSYVKHLFTAKHKIVTNNDKKVSEEVSHHECKPCGYITDKLSSYNKHLASIKHSRIVRNENHDKKFVCNCGKVYKFRQGLFTHSKLCKQENTSNIVNIIIPAGESELQPILEKSFTSDIIIEMMKENKEFKALLIEQAEQHQKQVIDLQKENNTLMNKMVEITQTQLTIPNTINNNTTNNNNQKFNLNFFLNETCKDAMNIQEFIENIKITFEDLLTIGNTGFVNGLSDIFMKQLRDLEVEKRPIHCTDPKRETIYLKANNEWSKDDKENKQLKDAIEKVEYKNVASLHQWCSENLDSKINNTPNNLLRDKIFLQTLQGDDKTRDKIIKNISKEITIDK